MRRAAAAALLAGLLGSGHCLGRWRSSARPASAPEAGIEILHDGMLRLMGKGTSALQNIQFLKWCAEQDIAVTWHLLFGIPGERPEFYPETLATARRLTHLPPPLKAGRVFLQRFSPYFQESGRWGVRDVRPTPLYRYVYPPARVRLEELAFPLRVGLAGAALGPARSGSAAAGSGGPLAGGLPGPADHDVFRKAWPSLPSPACRLNMASMRA